MPPVVRHLKRSAALDFPAPEAAGLIQPSDWNEVHAIEYSAGDLLLIDGEVPPGWLRCDSAAVGKADYPALYAAIGGRYGESATFFCLPYLRLPARKMQIDEGEGGVLLGVQQAPEAIEPVWYFICTGGQ